MGIVLLLSLLLVPADLPPNVLLIAHTLQANRKLVTRLPQYICLETMSRYRPIRAGRKPGKHGPQVQDIVQLDVGVGPQDEMYAWPGAKEFSPRDLFALVGHGILAGGLFRNFVNNLFIEQVGVITTLGTDVLEGKPAHHFVFTIPSLQNKWRINWLGADGWVGEKGEFWVDAADLSLLRLDVAATDIPTNLPLQSLTVTIRYRTLDSANGRALIPQSAALKAVERNGTLQQQTIDFSHCRAFETESNFRADAGGEELTRSLTRYEAQREVLPSGLLFPIQLKTAVQAGRTLVGDPISAVLERAVKTPAGDTIPKGAVLNGRIRQFQALDDPPNTSLVGLEFEELLWPGHSATFFASLVSLQALAGIESSLSHSRMERSFGRSFGDSSREITATVAPIAIPGVASFYLSGPGANLPQGFRMDWRTQTVGHP